MTGAKAAPYGSWASPITADLIVGEAIGLGQIALDGEDIYWTELRPAEKGRTVLMRRRADGVCEEMSPADANVRSRVHEYGGGAFTACDGRAWFSRDGDQAIYLCTAPGHAARVTAPGPWCFADLQADPGRRRLLAVREEQRDGGEPANALVAVGDGGAVRVLAEGADFYAAPRLAPQGDRLAWLQWQHPNMPWDGCELWLASVDASGGLAEPRRLAGGPDEALFQPSWSPSGALHVVSDRSGYWNLYRVAADGSLAPLCLMEADFGLPQWVFGMATYGFAADGTIVAAHVVDGVWRLGTIAPGSGRLAPLDTGYCGFDGIQVVGNRAVFLGGQVDAPAALVAVDVRDGSADVVRRSASFDLDPGYVSVAEPVSFASAGGRTAHGFYYPPQNKDFAGLAGSLPPLIVKTHGGPTGQTGNALNLKVQFWTSRGFAVLDVNYGGSTGYGRAYRRALLGQWGVVDVDDVVTGAEAMVAAGRADPARLIVTGGSAGGYTTLAALTFRDRFAAGASHYGIGDLTALARDTHKFESRYLDSLIGPWPVAAETYRARSPVNFPDGLSCPVIFFQGQEDKVVPPNQAEAMVASLRAKGVPVAYISFAGEAHGFRQGANVKRALEAELYFYGRVFGFPVADTVDPVPIENLG